MTTEKLEFLAQFGRDISNSPEVVPAFANYFQDMNGGLAKIGNLTKLNGAAMFPVDTPDVIYPDFDFKWYADGVFKTDTQNPIINEIKPDGYDGVFMVKLEILHKPTNTIYTREQWAFFDWNDEPNTLEGGDRPTRFGVFYTFYPEGEQFGRLKYDYDGDGKVTTTDLLEFVARHDGSEAAERIVLEKVRDTMRKSIDDEELAMLGGTQTKYDWTNVPEEVKWIATDVTGYVFGFIEKPIFQEATWMNKGIDWQLLDGHTPYAGDWKESLEQRPE